jgi:hypothetical protein
MQLKLSIISLFNYFDFYVIDILEKKLVFDFCDYVSIDVKKLQYSIKVFELSFQMFNSFNYLIFIYCTDDQIKPHFPMRKILLRISFSFLTSLTQFNNLNMVFFSSASLQVHKNPNKLYR